MRFEALGESGQQERYPFRVPVEGSRYFIQTDTGWRPTGYGGTLSIRAPDLALTEFTVESEQVGGDSFLCSTTSRMTYAANQGDVLLPNSVVIHDLDRDGSEAESRAKFSDCHTASGDIAPAASYSPLLPPEEKAPLDLELLTPIDTASAAAGDRIEARLASTLRTPDKEVVVTSGAVLSGRIMELEHHLEHCSFFLVWLDFDTITVNGAPHSIRLHLHCGPSVAGQGCTSVSLRDHKLDRAFTFETKNRSQDIVIPAGYRSRWITGGD